MQPQHQPGDAWNLEQFGIDAEDSDSSADLTSFVGHDADATGALMPVDTSSVHANYSSHSNYDFNVSSEVAPGGEGPTTLHVLPPSPQTDVRPQPSFDKPLDVESSGQDRNGSLASDTSSALLAPGVNRYGVPSPTLHGKLDVLGGDNASECGSSATPSVLGDLEDEQARLELSAERSMALLDLLMTSKMATEEVLQMPFPLFVFGTLRMHLSNNYLMGLPAENGCAPYSIGHFRRDHELAISLSGRMHKKERIGRSKFCHWQPAGVRYMHCDGLKILPNNARGKASLITSMSSCSSNSSDIMDLAESEVSAATGEMFFYDDANFASVIGPVDELESFTTTSVSGTSYQMGSYVRTLMWADALPYHCRSILNLDLSRTRTWPTAAFIEGTKETGVRVPVWVYSSVLSNIMISKHTPPGSVLIWAPHPCSKCEVEGGNIEYDLLARNGGRL